MKKLSRVEQLKAELKIATKIEKTNKVFNSLSKAEKRVFIAKDVLESLKSNRYQAKHLTYVNAYNKLKNETFNQDSINRDDFSCKVCALGAIFSSKVKIANDFECQIDEYGLVDLYGSELNGYDIRDNLEKYFSRTQLKSIENAFEGNDCDVEEGYNLNKKYKEFFNKYNNAEERLTAIMKNIISNKGLFKI